MKKRNLFISLVLCFTLVGCSSNNIENQTTISTTEITTQNITESTTNETTQEITEVTTEEETTEEEIIESSVSMVVAGDNLYHMPIITKGFNGTSYNFDFVYKNVKDYISFYDLAVINQETVLVDDYNDISSYPCFGTPSEAATALKEAGFDIFLGATNHTLDKGIKGINTTLDFYNENDITYLGINKDVDEYNTVKIIEKNNIKIAMLNYTYGMNGLTLPSDNYYMVNLLDDKDKIISDLKYAEENADITIVFPHWGTEYVYTETDYQKEYAELFTEYGADIIVGSHPHVVEPVKYIESENGNVALCYYSLGNFVSGQNEKPRLLGGLASFTIHKTVENGNAIITVTDEKFEPTVTYYNSTEHCVYLLKDFTDDIAADSTMQAYPDELWNLWKEINEVSEINID